VDKCHTASCNPATGECVQTAIPCTPIDICHDASCDPATGECVQTANSNCQNGCTPGFWKNCVRQWCGTYTTSQKVSSVFTVPACIGSPNLGNATLLQSLSFRGGSSVNGGAQILLRAATAALLNACKDIGYPLDTAQVISQVNTALASCDRATLIALAGTLDGYNNLGCQDRSGNGLRCLR
jgi:hypothetical protein